MRMENFGWLLEEEWEKFSILKMVDVIRVVIYLKINSVFVRDNVIICELNKKLFFVILKKLVIMYI